MADTQPTPHNAILRAILDSPEDIVIFALDRDYRYLAFNDNHRRTMQSIWGVDIEVGVSMLSYVSRVDDRQKAKANFDRALAGEHFTIVEAYGDEARDRRYYEDVYSPIVDADGDVIGLTLYLTDITEQRRTQQELAEYRRRLEELVDERTNELQKAHAELLHAQKLESLGVMAGGIAHDFNNLLAGMLGFADLALAEIGDEGPGATKVNEVIRIATRAARLTQQLLAYAGQAPTEVGPVDWSQVVQDSASLLRASTGSSITLQLDLDEDLPPVEADPTQLQQVLLNLVLNGAEALGDDPGTVRITTRCKEVDAKTLGRAWVGDGLQPGPYVSLRVEDDGCGMDAETRERLFDPFFTSKFAGRGLGLASVLGIVRSHGGAILVRSAVDQGSTFEVLLPAAEEGLQEPLEPDEPTTSTPSSADTVLIVDDEPQVRAIARAATELRGLQVAEAADGEEGVAEVRSRGETLVAVVLDLTMPRLGGEAALTRIRELQPDIPVLVISGWTRDHERLRFLAHTPHTSFLQKPFRLAQFHEALDALLGGPGGPE